MRQAGLLAAAFIVTLTLLSGGFFAIQAVSAPAPAPTPAAPATLAATPAPTIRPTAAPTPAASPTPAATARSTVAPTVAPTVESSPLATTAPAADPSSSALPAGPTGKIVVVVLGSQYLSADVPQGTLTRGNGGAITITTGRTVSSELTVEWQLPAAAIPAGFTLRSVDVRVCGTGSGDFWETYGPQGSNPEEHEVTAPQADGCWHYAGAPGPDTTVKAIIRLASTMTITRLEYTVTVSK